MQGIRQIVFATSMTVLGSLVVQRFRRAQTVSPLPPGPLELKPSVAPDRTAPEPLPRDTTPERAVRGIAPSRSRLPRS